MNGSSVTHFYSDHCMHHPMLHSLKMKKKPIQENGHFHSKWYTVKKMPDFCNMHLKEKIKVCQLNVS